jgi:ketosteroid isomerase-like protein
MTFGSRVLALACLLFPLGASAQSAPSARALTEKDLAALRAIAEQDASLVRARKWDVLASEYAEDAVRMPPNGPAVQGRAAIRHWLEGLPPISAFDFRMVDLQGDGEIAYMRATWSISAAPVGGAPVSDSGKILVVFRKQPGGNWLRVADAWNSDRAPKQ